MWEAGGLGTNPIPAPVKAGEIVIVMSGHRSPNLLAIQLGGHGDLTDQPEYIKWTNQRGNSYTASPVLHDGILYVLTDRGMISAFEAASGEAFYRQQRLPDIHQFKASPVAAAGKLYLASEEGDVIVLKLGRTYEVLATNRMDEEMFIASPIVIGREIFLRSQDRLYCIAETDESD
jgi:outer membrane protein assembly factor BamB